MKRPVNRRPSVLSREIMEDILPKPHMTAQKDNDMSRYVIVRLYCASLTEGNFSAKKADITSMLPRAGTTISVPPRLRSICYLPAFQIGRKNHITQGSPETGLQSTTLFRNGDSLAAGTALPHFPRRFA